MLPKHHDGHGDGQMALLKLGVSYASLYLFAHFRLSRAGMSRVFVVTGSGRAVRVSCFLLTRLPFGIVAEVTQSSWQVQHT